MWVEGEGHGHEWALVPSPLLVYQKGYDEGQRVLVRLRDGTDISGLIRAFNDQGTVFMENAQVRTRSVEGRPQLCLHRCTHIEAETIWVVCLMRESMAAAVETLDRISSRAN